MAIKDSRSRPKRWRFPNHLVNDSAFVVMINAQLECYFNIDSNSASPAIVWEALKAYIRGNIISYSSWKKKQYVAKLNSLEMDIKSLEKQHFQLQSQTILDQLTVMKAEYDTITTREVENAMARLKQRYYEHGDYAGKLLTWQIRQKDAARYIPIIKQNDGELVRNPLLINQAFADFYKSLYSSQGEKSQEMYEFLDGLDIPKIPDSCIGDLEKAITKQEVLDAMARLPSG